MTTGHLPRKLRLEEASTLEQVLEDQLQDPAFRAEWERTALAPSRTPSCATGRSGD